MLLLNTVQHFTDVFSSILQVCHSYLKTVAQSFKLFELLVKEPHAYNKEEMDIYQGIDKENIHQLRKEEKECLREDERSYTTQDDKPFTSKTSKSRFSGTYPTGNKIKAQLLAGLVHQVPSGEGQYLFNSRTAVFYFIFPYPNVFMNKFFLHHNYGSIGNSLSILTR